MIAGKCVVRTRKRHEFDKATERIIIVFRLCVLVLCCLRGTAPSNLADSVRSTADVDGRRLRSANAQSLVVPSIVRCDGCDHAQRGT